MKKYNSIRGFCELIYDIEIFIRESTTTQHRTSNVTRLAGLINLKEQLRIKKEELKNVITIKEHLLFIYLFMWKS